MRLRLVAASLALVGCGTPADPTDAQRASAVVRFSSNVRDAQLYMDGRFIGSLDVMRGGVAVVPGVHRFELRHEDFFSSYLELELARAERREVKLELAPVLP